MEAREEPQQEVACEAGDLIQAGTGVAQEAAGDVCGLQGAGASSTEAPPQDVAAEPQGLTKAVTETAQEAAGDTCGLLRAGTGSTKAPSSSISEGFSDSESRLAGGVAGAQPEDGGQSAPASQEAAPGPQRTKRRKRGQTSSSGVRQKGSGGSSSSGSSSGADSSSSDSESCEFSDISDEEAVDDEGSQAAPLDDKDMVMVPEDVPLDPNYPVDWQGAVAPGIAGFNRIAALRLLKPLKKAARVASAAAETVSRKNAPCPPLQPHQQAVAYLLHPQSPVTRLLVDHPTGSGKTREMIRVLDNFFLDHRPKVPIFPKEPVCRNFYAELLRWPSRYRDFFCCLQPDDAARASGAKSWRKRREKFWDLSDVSDPELRELCTNMRETLEMKNWFYMGKMLRSKQNDFKRRFPNEVLPGGPLRALRYSSAGGRHTQLRDGWPISALLKVAFDRDGQNVYSNKIVVMDEVHNLVRVQTQFAEQLTNLRELLSGAKGMVLAGFTGTPILNEAKEGRQLLDIVKGRFAPPGDEGFLSSFPFRPAELFPASLPAGIPDGILTPKLRRRFVQRVTLIGEALNRYDTKRRKGMPEHNLHRYCNLSVHFGSMHDGKFSTKARVLADMAACAPKLHAIARDVARRPEKALVLINRSSGLEALIDHLHALAVAGGAQEGADEEPPKPAFGVATMDQIAAFNSRANLRGEMYRVLVADALTCSEGVSFFGVRRLHLADVPKSPSALIQSVGRTIRMHGHRGLPEEERTVTTTMHVAGMPRWMRSPLGAWALQAQKRHKDPRSTLSGARRLLRTLLKAGTSNLNQLKALVDERSRASTSVPAEPRAEPAEAVEKKPLEPNEMVGLLEQLSLWDQAKAMRSRHQQKKKKGPTFQRRVARAAAAKVASMSGAGAAPRPPGRPAKAQRTLGTASASEGPHSVERPAPSPQPVGQSMERPAPPLKPAGPPAGDGSEGAAQPQQAAQAIATDASAAEPGPSQEGVPGQVTEIQEERPAVPGPASAAVGEAGGAAAAASAPEEHANQEQERQRAHRSWWQRDALANAVMDLYLASTAEEAAERMRLMSETADERALRQLARNTREFAPALAQLRKKAIDRAVLRHLCIGKQGQNEENESDGESSAHEFGVSDKSEGEDGAADTQPRRQSGAAKAATPLMVLPQGWVVSRTRQGKREIREFVDPSGKRYKTEGEARRAIDNARRRENLSRILSSRFFAESGKSEKAESSSAAGGVSARKGEESSPTRKASSPRSNAAQPGAAPQGGSAEASMEDPWNPSQGSTDSLAEADGRALPTAVATGEDRRSPSRGAADSRTWADCPARPTPAAADEDRQSRSQVTADGRAGADTHAESTPLAADEASVSAPAAADEASEPGHADAGSCCRSSPAPAVAGGAANDAEAYLATEQDMKSGAAAQKQVPLPTPPRRRLLRKCSSGLTAPGPAASPEHAIFRTPTLRPDASPKAASPVPMETPEPKRPLQECSTPASKRLCPRAMAA